MKKIVKTRIGRCYDRIFNEVYYQLQFKIEGERQFNGFSDDTFGNISAAKAALRFHNSGELPYVVAATNGKYCICKTI